MAPKLLITIPISLMTLVGISQSVDETKYATEVMESSEFIEKNEEIIKLSDGKRSLSLLLVSEPNEKQTYYYYTASEDNGMSYVTHLHFRVYPMKGVCLYDPERDEETKLNKK